MGAVFLHAVAEPAGGKCRLLHVVPISFSSLLYNGPRPPYLVFRECLLRSFPTAARLDFFMKLSRRWRSRSKRSSRRIIAGLPPWRVIRVCTALPNFTFFTLLSACCSNQTMRLSTFSDEREMPFFNSSTFINPNVWSEACSTLPPLPLPLLPPLVPFDVLLLMSCPTS